MCFLLWCSSVVLPIVLAVCIEASSGLCVLCSILLEHGVVMYPLQRLCYEIFYLIFFLIRTHP